MQKDTEISITVKRSSKNVLFSNKYYYFYLFKNYNKYR